MIHKKDEKYLQILPESPNFDPEKNKRVIENTIKKTDELRANKAKEFDEAYRERAAAMAQYLRSLQQGQAGDVEKYFGRRELARLRGEEVVSRLQDQLRVIGKNGKVIRERPS